MKDLWVSTIDILCSLIDVIEKKTTDYIASQCDIEQCINELQAQFWQTENEH